MQCQENQFQVYSPNGRKLNIASNRRIKDVVYLSHGSILNIKLLKQIKNSAFQQRASFLSAGSKISRITQLSPPKPKCVHPQNVKCIHCSQTEKKDPFAGTGQLINQEAVNQEKLRQSAYSKKEKGSKLNVKEVKSQQKIVKKIRSPIKLNPSTPCRHKPDITCKKCEDKPSKLKSIALIKEPQSIINKQPKQVKQQEKIQKKCNHGQNAKCIHCMESPSKKDQKGKCTHGADGKCIHYLPVKEQPTYLPFDQYLQQRKINCRHSSQSQCINCIAPVNPRLKVDRSCSKHPPFPEALCSSCQPEAVTIVSQKYRHVDYVQFMNTEQMHNFVKYWLSERPNQMRFGYLYGYFADDPFYHNGIRAIVEAIYEPHQYCNSQEFYILDGDERKKNIEIVAQSLQLQKIGMIIASTNDGQCPLTQTQVRVIARIQQKEIVTHSNGYKMSNFFTVVVRKNSDPKKSIQPQVFMISDQGQALEVAGMFTQNKKHAYKMKIRDHNINNQPLPSIYLAGKNASQIQIQYFLVKIVTGIGKNKKFSILKNNLFPPSSRGKIKSKQMKQYVNKTKHQPNIVRFGDFNLLIFIAEAIDTATAAEIGSSVAQQKDVNEDLCMLVEGTLDQLAA